MTCSTRLSPKEPLSAENAISFMSPRADRFSGVLPEIFRTGKGGGFSGFRCDIGTGNGRIIRQQEGVSPPVNRTLSVLECSCQGVGGRYPIVGPVAELNLLFSQRIPASPVTARELVLLLSCRWTLFCGPEFSRRIYARERPK